ncbi:hypothetical protein GDO86_007061 [Hymenochirus boettgeri]|uniref:Olfactory receptor n=1 Tax=Hymenochirus boettgeri TaxID=247094 RepID=A0A8T2JB03_9PIPI|nr:hypothetical protein GDO86_007061 [Hymenochirus boettgeri]
MNITNRCTKAKITEFLLHGFTCSVTMNVLLFSLCFGIYIVSLIVNFTIIGLYLGSQHLRSPMYFFLCHLSITDIMLSTSVVPIFLSTLLGSGETISVSACVTQFFCCSFFTGVECFLLTVMSYDRYLAICNPLHYVKIMTYKHCLCLVTWTWFLMFVGVLTLTITICHSGFFGCNILDDIYCDYAPLLEISCSDIFIVEIEKVILNIFLTFLPFICIITSYINIIISILRISTSTGRQKAFSTCVSHLTVVCTYYGILIAKYTVPSKSQSSFVNKVISLVYTTVAPLLNPIIYSIRNQDVRKALSKCISLNLRMFDIHFL